jgi:hypothetical protein
VIWIFQAIGMGRSVPAFVPGSDLGLIDPDAARLFPIRTANPGLFEADPDAALAVSITTANPGLYESDPDAARLIPL